MSNKNKLHTRKMYLENKDKMILHYYLIEKQGDSGNIYGIEVEKYINKPDKCIYECNSVPNISYSPKYTKELLETIANGFVTPISLDVVLDNLMNEVS